MDGNSQIFRWIVTQFKEMATIGSAKLRWKQRLPKGGSLAVWLVNAGQVGSP